MKFATFILLMAALLAPAQVRSQRALQEQRTLQLDESGHIVQAGHSSPYLIRHLPVSSFPELPSAVVGLLNLRSCVIPQTYEAHRPGECSTRQPGAGWLFRLGGALFGRGNCVAAGLLWQCACAVRGAGFGTGNPAPAGVRRDGCSRLQLGHRSRIAKANSRRSNRHGASATDDGPRRAGRFSR